MGHKVGQAGQIEQGVESVIGQKIVGQSVINKKIDDSNSIVGSSSGSSVGSSSGSSVGSSSGSSEGSSIVGSNLTVDRNRSISQGTSADILNYAAEQNCPELHMFIDKDTDLKAMIAIHSTALGPALGGCRCIEYASTTEAAIDAIRLAQGMTYKAAMAHLPLGGGKMVVLKPKHIKDRTLFFQAVGRAVDSLQGRYITAEDSGTSVEDMDIIATTTRHVTGRTHGKLTEADPSIFTALGMVRGIQAAVKYKLNKDTLEGVHVGIQGVGHVGYKMAKDLHNLGARLTVYDVQQAPLEQCKKEFNANIVHSLDELLTTDCDVFSPCALGAVLNDDTISKLKAPIVAGSANNQLAEPRHGEMLKQRGILYAPDYVISAGGLIHVVVEFSHISEVQARDKINGIYDTLLEVFKRADNENRSTNEVADEIAVERLKQGQATKK